MGQFGADGPLDLVRFQLAKVAHVIDGYCALSDANMALQHGAFGSLGGSNQTRRAWPLPLHFFRA